MSHLRTFSFYCCRTNQALHSFPTRRSSDLAPSTHGVCCRHDGRPWSSVWAATARDRWWRWRRSEEHTSELQSRFDLVCRLLLENKKRAYHLSYLPTDIAAAMEGGVRAKLLF